MKSWDLWFEERLHLASWKRLLAEKSVPRHRYSFWYLFGGLALFFFLIQMLSGTLLLLYYSPTPNTANESTDFIINKVPLGWLVHSMHMWSANLMIVCLFLHLFSTFYMRAYRNPREITWLSGVFLLFLIMGFGFTGYLLPWDTKAYFATQIGTEIPKSVPLIGDLLVSVLRGGEYVGDETLKRLFALHAVVLPLATCAVIFFHLLLNFIHGSSIPQNARTLKTSVRFFPDYIYRDLLAWIGGLIILLMFSLLFPIHVGPRADPLASAPPGIKPEWYFLPLYQTLRMLPASIAGVGSEVIVNILVSLLGIAILSVPFLDGHAEQDRPTPWIKWGGIAIFCYLGLTAFLGYFT